jgi:hypothetical protein
VPNDFDIAHAKRQREVQLKKVAKIPFLTIALLTHGILYSGWEISDNSVTEDGKLQKYILEHIKTENSSDKIPLIGMVGVLLNVDQRLIHLTALPSNDKKVWKKNTKKLIEFYDYLKFSNFPMKYVTFNINSLSFMVWRDDDDIDSEYQLVIFIKRYIRFENVNPLALQHKLDLIEKLQLGEYRKEILRAHPLFYCGQMS